MKVINKAFTLKVFISTLMLLSALNAADLDWLHDYDKALEQAKKENKNVYLYVGADKCRFCNKFSNTTLKDKDILQRLNKDFVLVYMSRDRHKVPPQFKTKGVPLHYFINADGKVIYTDWGASEVSGFTMILDNVELNLEE